MVEDGGSWPSRLMKATPDLNSSLLPPPQNRERKKMYEVNCREKTRVKVNASDQHSPRLCWSSES